MNTQKTPYEIRTELLKLAVEILSSQREGDTDKIKHFTTEDVIKHAQKMNEFVSAPALSNHSKHKKSEGEK